MIPTPYAFVHTLELTARVSKMSTDSTKPTVFVVDDDPDVRKALRWLIEGIGLDVELYTNGREFLDTYDPSRPGCLVLDVRMPGLSGVELQEELKARGGEIPVIMITGFGDVPTAVRAMRSGAVDFIEKPFSDQVLLDKIQRSIEQDAVNRQMRASHEQIMARLKLLTSREREVMELIVEGRPSSEIARQLGISLKTVHVHRAHVRKKMRAANVAELVSMTRSSGVK